jgi:hypothetical protein
MIGIIQVGEEPGGSAQVIVPATAFPLAAGTEPNTPVDELTDPLEPPPAQAARPMAAAVAAAATHAASIPGRREMVIGVSSQSFRGPAAATDPGEHAGWREHMDGHVAIWGEYCHKLPSM